MEPKQALLLLGEVIKNSPCPVKISDAMAYCNQIQQAFNALEEAIFPKQEPSEDKNTDK